MHSKKSNNTELMRRNTIQYILLFCIICTLNSCGPEADIPADAEYGKGADIKVIKFYADWCLPCQTMKPEYEKVKKLYPHVGFYEVDFDKNREKAAQFGIESVPFVIRLKNRNEVKKKLGYMSRNDLIRFIEN